MKKSTEYLYERPLSNINVILLRTMQDAVEEWKEVLHELGELITYDYSLGEKATPAYMDRSAIHESFVGMLHLN